MKDEEKEIVTVENKGGKGNPNHAPKGAPNGTGGQFVSDSEDALGVVELKEAHLTSVSSKFVDFLRKKKEQKEQEAIDFINNIKGNVDEEHQKFYDNLSREEKLELLFESPNGYDKKRLKLATDGQLTALLYAEAIKNKDHQLQQEIEIWKKHKKDIDEEIEEVLSQNNIDGISGVWAYVTKYPSDWKELKESGSIDKKKEYYNSVLSNSNSSVSDKFKATQYLKKLEEFEKAGQEYENLKNEVLEKHIDELEEIENKITELLGEQQNFKPNSPLATEAQKYLDTFVDVNEIYSQARKNNALWITEKWIKEHPEYEGLSVSEASVKYLGAKFTSMWNKMTSQERNQLVDYTGGGYSKYNKPLRGKGHGGWNDWAFAQGVTTLTNAINKCVWDEDIWVQRGMPVNDLKLRTNDGAVSNLADFFAKGKENLVIGTSFTDLGFYSSGAGKGTGFSNNNLIINTYCPKGTKMAYMNTHGQYANSSENEMILQRGYSYRITKVEKKGNQYYMDVEVILDSDKQNNITDMEELEKIGKKYLG